jgi:hypothetical protein
MRAAGGASNKPPDNRGRTGVRVYDFSRFKRPGWNCATLSYPVTSRGDRVQRWCNVFQVCKDCGLDPGLRSPL